MSEDFARDLYLERGARGVEDESDAWAAVDRLSAALARTERAVEVSPAGAAAVEALAGLLAWRVVDSSAEYGDAAWWSALYRLRDLADRLAR